MNYKKTVQLGNFSQIFKGLPKISATNSTCQMVQWTNIKSWLDGNTLETQISGMAQKNYNNVFPFMKKGDIIISVFTGEVLYVDMEVKGKYLYGQSVFVVRIDENVTSSEYIYILLNTKKYRDITSLSKYGYNKKIRKADIDKLPIPIIDKKEMIKITDEFRELNDKYMEYRREVLETKEKIEKFFDGIDVL